MTIIDIAKICHEANKAYCETIGDYTQKSWPDAEKWQRDSAIAGVQWRLEHLEAPASAQQDAWVADKLAAGWKFGTVKDPAKKEHPCIVPYDNLPIEQKAKDDLFMSIVNGLKHLYL